MQRRGPVLLQSLCMFGREIALMAGQAVLREDLIPDAHALVAPDLGDDGGGGDGVALRVALDQGTLGSASSRQTLATMEAAAMAWHCASPLIKGRWGVGSDNGTASISRKSGAGVRRATAISMAILEAW